jgi:protein-disulfide isomerase
MPSNEQQNVWFGIAMFLLGFIAGVILTLASGAVTGVSIGGTQAPTAPTGQTAPQVSLTDKMYEIVKGLGIDESSFKACVTSTKYNALISSQQVAGQQAGVNGTPGNILYSAKTKKGRLISGAQPFANFQKEIDDMLKNPGKDSTNPNIPSADSVPPPDFTKDHYVGDKNAPLALIEYTDYECPFCHRVQPTYKQIMDQYDGKVVWVLRHYPLSFHPSAMPLAVGAECVNELAGADAFWSYTDQVMSLN